MSRFEVGDGSRLSFGGEEFIFVEVAEAMSLAVSMRVVAITDALRAQDQRGVVDICPSNVSYMLRVDPEVVDPMSLVPVLSDLHAELGSVQVPVISTRIIEMPVLYGDPWTTEVLMRFRDRHQTPNQTDLEFVSAFNGFATVDDFVAAHSGSPFIATFIGFVPGNAESFQLAPDDRQLQAPKYVRPRTDTPARAVGCGGAFTSVYPVKGGGGFQLLGRSVSPVFDRDQRLPDFADSMVLPKAGDIFRYRSVEREEYDELYAQVEAGTFRLVQRPVEFDYAKFRSDPMTYNKALMEGLK